MFLLTIRSSLYTWREEDLEFTTDPNFFELIFNVLTLVTKIWALAMDHWSLVTKIWAWAMDHWPLVTKIWAWAMFKLTGQFRQTQGKI